MEGERVAAGHGWSHVQAVFVVPEFKARDREARCCTQTINRSSLRQRHPRSPQICRLVIAVCAGARPPSSCTGRTSATEAPTRQRMEARRITTGSARWPRARQRRVTMGCGPGAVEIGGFSTSSTPGPPSRLRSRQAAPSDANRPRFGGSMALGGQRVGDALAADLLLVGASGPPAASSVTRLRLQATFPASLPADPMRSPEEGRLCGCGRVWHLAVPETA